MVAPSIQGWKAASVLAGNHTLCPGPLWGHIIWVRQMACTLRLFVSLLLCLHAEASEVSADVRRAACGRYAPQQLDAAIMTHPGCSLVPQHNKFRSKAGYRCAFSCASSAHAACFTACAGLPTTQAIYGAHSISYAVRVRGERSWHCRGVDQPKRRNKWRAQRSIRGRKHTALFDTRTEAALFYDLLGGDGANFPGDSDDADQMAETLRDVRSLHSA